jgi:hypothetical protein
MLGFKMNEQPAGLLSKQVARELTFAELDQVAGGEYSENSLSTDITGTNCNPSVTYDCTDGHGD